MSRQSLAGKRLKIAVLGGHGMLGADIVKFLAADYLVSPITRENYAAHTNKKFDVLINANGNGKVFWANKNPFEDFMASTASVYKSLFDFKFKKYIYISSANVYEYPSSPAKTSEKRRINPTNLVPYGFHKYVSEVIVRRTAENYIILRCPMLLGSSMKRGIFYDILNSRPLLATLDSKVQLITTKAVAEIITAFLSQGVSREVFNVGGVGTFFLRDLPRYSGRSISVSKDAKKQICEMDISKLKKIYSPKKSVEYAQEFLNDN